jgi:spermidine synthase
VEHFAAVRARIERGGLFCQWLPLHQLDLDTLRSIVRSFMSVFPDGSALIASHSLATPVIGLLGGDAAARVDPLALRDRLSHWALSKQASALGLEDELALLGSFVAGPEALQRFGANSPINSDDLPIVAYRAPRITYAPDSSPGDRLIALLREVWIEPQQLIAATADASWAQRLTAYAAARDLFIVAGRDVRPLPRVEQMLARVRVPLFAVLRASPEFRPAYDPLLVMAKTLAQSDRAAARTLLIDLARIQPARNEAPQLLAQLGGDVVSANVEAVRE